METNKAVAPVDVKALKAAKEAKAANVQRPGTIPQDFKVIGETAPETQTIEPQGRQTYPGDSGTAIMMETTNETIPPREGSQTPQVEEKPTTEEIKAVTADNQPKSDVITDAFKKLLGVDEKVANDPFPESQVDLSTPKADVDIANGSSPYSGKIVLQGQPAYHLTENEIHDLAYGTDSDLIDFLAAYVKEFNVDYRLRSQIWLGIYNYNGVIIKHVSGDSL